MPRRRRRERPPRGEQRRRHDPTAPHAIASRTSPTSARRATSACAFDVAPDSHAFQWKKLHGPTVRAHDTATANNCALCHQDEKDCGPVTSPSHRTTTTNYFRIRGHGLHARMDRQNCAACHRSDSCDACHRDTRAHQPRRVVRWDLQQPLHQLPSAAAEQRVLHVSQGHPSHALAPPRSRPRPCTRPA
jgi:hypothetical protein